MNVISNVHFQQIQYTSFIQTVFLRDQLSTRICYSYVIFIPDIYLVPVSYENPTWSLWNRALLERERNTRAAHILKY